MIGFTVLFWMCELLYLSIIVGSFCNDDSLAKKEWFKWQNLAVIMIGAGVAPISISYLLFCVFQAQVRQKKIQKIAKIVAKAFHDVAYVCGNGAKTYQVGGGQMHLDLLSDKELNLLGNLTSDLYDLDEPMQRAISDEIAARTVLGDSGEEK